MNEREVKSLLAIATGYDGRLSGNVELENWKMVAAIQRWTFEEARDAMHSHYANSSEFAMPAMITKIIKDRRQDERMRDTSDLFGKTDDPSSPPVFDGGWPVGDDPWGGTRNSAGLEAVHAEANVEPCPYCNAQVGVRCTNKITGSATKIPHPARLVKAKVR